MNPLRWVLNNSISDHIQIDINQTSEKVFACFYGRCVITIIPKGTFAGFPLIVFLSRFAGDYSSSQMN